MDNLPNEPPGPEPNPNPSDLFRGASLAEFYLLVPVALFALGRFGWDHFGSLGLILGLVLAIAIISVAVGLLGMLRVFDPDTKRSPSDPDQPPAPEAPGPPPPARRGQVGVFAIMAAIAVLAAWLGVGIAVVRPVRNPEDKLVTAIGVFVVPWLFVAAYRALIWADRLNDTAGRGRRKAGRGGRP